MHEWLQTALVALAAVAVWVLWSRGPQEPWHRGKFHRRDQAGTAPLAGRPRSARNGDGGSDDDGAEDPAIGPYPRLAAAVAELRADFKALRNEWIDKESRVDSLLKRINRLRKLEGDNEPESGPTPVLSAAEQRAAIVRRARESGGM